MWQCSNGMQRKCIINDIATVNMAICVVSHQCAQSVSSESICATYPVESD